MLGVQLEYAAGQCVSLTQRTCRAFGQHLGILEAVRLAEKYGLVGQPVRYAILLPAHKLASVSTCWPRRQHGCSQQLTCTRG